PTLCPYSKLVRSVDVGSEVWAVFEAACAEPRAGSSVSSKRTLSPNEAAFEEYLQNRFNESWMREVKVRFLAENEEGIPLREGESPERDSE
ncbi:MAG: hypothetical protein QGH70_07670, partial [Nitrospinota bacterium]|nr:hypothetical protein [Nitrospinota bacterium]